MTIIGAGAGGLAAAIDLATQGADVTVLEAAAGPGGKMRQARVDGVGIDVGPTVFTMRWVFDALFTDAGASLGESLVLRPLEILARHAWSGSERLDLFADIGRSTEAIAAFAGRKEADGYRDFCTRSQRVWRTLQDPFVRAPRPTALSLAAGAGLRGLTDLWGISPFATLWQALGQHFRDPRLRQLFGRYATYSGSSPFAAPATLMLIAHVEQEGVWMVAGGMVRLAAALAELAIRKGASLRHDARVAEILVTGGRATGVMLASGERIAADAVVCNGDVAALAAGALGPASIRAVPASKPADRSLSALTWAMSAATEGFPLTRHNVFFSSDYAAEFDDIFRRLRLPGAPTVYVCAQDRGETDTPPPAERLLILVNAPATGDGIGFSPKEIERCQNATFGLLEHCGLAVHPMAVEVTTPTDFHTRFPATGGALYGRAVHGAMAAFKRPGARSAISGLYLAGGSVHPGPGVPMAVLSGRMAASSLLADLVSTTPRRLGAISGGMSMR